MNATPPDNKPAQVGQFVWTPDRYRLGQVADVRQGRYVVRFFRSVNRSFDVEYDYSQLTRAYLSPQTRAYYRDDFGVWMVGRIADYFTHDGELWYEVRFPNQVERSVREIDLKVRCMLMADDPAAVLASGGMETQYLHDRRRAALECLTSAKQATYGLTALLSASVQLMPHQLQVVRRVLNDPVQRYLLADEVGLGKTIEACAIIKQAVSDNDSERIAVIVPTPLIGQWKRELSWRFFIDSIEQQLDVVSYDDLHSLEPSAIDTLVIDEAHNLIPPDPENDPRYRLIERMAANADRLLLISATPVLSNAPTLLALLHLLDPQSYRLGDHDAFLEKVELRQTFGQLLLALNPNQSPFSLRRSLRRLRDLIPDDDVVEVLQGEIEEALSNGQADRTTERLRSLHRHVGDTYRLHQRLIRTRRRDVPDWVLPARSAKLDDAWQDEDDRTPLLADAIDQWRQRSLEALALQQNGAGAEFERHMARRYSRLVEALGVGVDTCAEEIRSQIDAVRRELPLGFDEDHPALEFALAQTETPTTETRASTATWLIDCALRDLEAVSQRPRLVVFGSDTALVSDVADRLEKARIADVFRVVENSSEQEVVDAVDGFWSAGNRTVLMCDRRGEEGLNLQYAHGMVHLDLPLASGRVEQRIGRLDRFGRELIESPEICHWIILPYAGENDPWQAWFELLRDGFQVFDQSISEVQFVLDDLEDKVRIELYRRGPAGLRGSETRIADAISLERQRLDEQYALDRRTIDFGHTQETFQAIRDRDTPWHYKPIDDWIVRTLMFQRHRLQDHEFRLHWTDRTLLPRNPWGRVISAEDLDQPMTYDRDHAARHRGVRLFRPGLPLVDKLERLLRWDDRGTVFATWRMDPAWVGSTRDIWLGFRLVYSVESNLADARAALSGVVDPQALQRRMDSLLPPWTTTLDIDLSMQPVTDPGLTTVLNRPYDPGLGPDGCRDFNLGRLRDALYDVIDFEELAKSCARVREISEELLRNSAAFDRWIESHAHPAVRELYAENQMLERRAAAFDMETGSPGAGIDREIAVNKAIAEALASPTVRLDSIGFFIVSPRPPMASGTGA